MPRYVLFTRLNAQGYEAIRSQPELIAEASREMDALDAKIVQQFALIGPYDFLTVVEAPHNLAAIRAATEREATGRLRTEVLPAIDLDLFVRLLGQTTETVGPYPWQISRWAQIVRRIMRYHTATRTVWKHCKPFEVEGREHLGGLQNPAIFIGNHSSHMDAFVLFTALPERFRRRVAFGGAADRWFLKGRKGIQKQPWYSSLTMNTFPIQRGGGRAALGYAEWLLDRRWSLVIFPEGTRSTTGKLAHFRHGVSILALAKNVPVVPIYLDGLRELRPKGAREIKEGPVLVRIGEPIRFAPGTEVSDATRTLYKAMERMREEMRRRSPRTAPAREAALVGATGSAQDG
jgi:1-acyl-sn-glycerol-3-phosphate acyltransferase